MKTSILSIATAMALFVSPLAHADLEDLFIGGESEDTVAKADELKDDLKVEDGEDIDDPVPNKGKGKKVVAEAPVLNNQADDLDLESEVVEADIVALEKITSDDTEEIKGLKRDVARLEGQLRGLKSASERAIKKSEITKKKLELQTRMKRDAETRLAKTEQVKRRQDKRLSQLQARVEAVENKAAAAKSRNSELKGDISDREREVRELERRVKRAEAQVLKQKEARKRLAMKRAKLREKKASLQIRANRADKKLAANG